jgi:hypothetical protein
MFPAVVVVKIPVGIKVMVPPPVDIGAGGVIVTIGVTPLINVMSFVGAIVVALAIVGAAADVANTSVSVGEVNTGVVIVGEVANTADPVPVSSVKAVRKLADVGVAKKVATLAPRPDTPVEIGRLVQFDRLPLVGVPNSGVVNTIEVLVQFDRLPLVGVPNIGVVNTIEVLVQFDRLPLVGVPSAGVTNAGLVNRLVTDNCLVVLVAA